MVKRYEWGLGDLPNGKGWAESHFEFSPIMYLYLNGCDYRITIPTLYQTHLVFIDRIWTGLASNRWACSLTTIPEAKLPWATSARSSGQDSTASLCPTLTVRLASAIMTLGIVQPLLSEHPGDPTEMGLNDSCAIEEIFCCPQCAQLFTHISGFCSCIVLH